MTIQSSHYQKVTIFISSTQTILFPILKMTVNINWLLVISSGIIPLYPSFTTLCLYLFVSQIKQPKGQQRNKNGSTHSCMRRGLPALNRHIDKNLQFFYILLTSLFKRIYCIYIIFLSLSVAAANETSSLLVCSLLWIDGLGFWFKIKW